MEVNNHVMMNSFRFDLPKMRDDPAEEDPVQRRSGSKKIGFKEDPVQRRSGSKKIRFKEDPVQRRSGSKKICFKKDPLN